MAFHYLQEGKLVAKETAPPLPQGHVRVVCISDTHEEHRNLVVPPGDVLVHAGDILRQSRLQDVASAERSFRDFASWLGEQPHRYKVVICGNHDIRLMDLGKDRLQQILDASSYGSEVHYLENESADVGGLKFYGSPFSVGGSYNSAWQHKHDTGLYNAVPEGIDVLVTHGPGFVIGKGDKVVVKNLVEAIQRTTPRLHVCGHLHWAYGLTRIGNTACVCASNLDGHYNLTQLPIVCDVLPRCEGEDAEALAHPLPLEVVPPRPTLLFFCPTDPSAERRLLGMMERYCKVTVLTDADNAAEASSGVEFVVAKLGTSSNNYRTVLDAVRRKSPGAKVAIHSNTARRSSTTCSKLQDQGVSLIVDKSTESDLLPWITSNLHN